jgi:hypothetical protein
MRAARKGRLLLDAQGDVLASTDPSALQVYKIMKFSQEAVKRYALKSNRIGSLKDLESRMDNAIKGLNYEIKLKESVCDRLMTQIKEQ